MSARKSSAGLRVIGTLKLVSAGLLIAVGIGIFHLLGKDLGESAEHFVHKLHLDPENKHITELLASVSGISHKQLKALDAGTFVYALLYIIEGVGLLLAKHWAEYLTIAATASLVPVEFYEIAHKPSVTKIAVLMVNLVIVFYLIYRMRVDRREAVAG